MNRDLILMLLIVLILGYILGMMSFYYLEKYNIIKLN